MAKRVSLTEYIKRHVWAFLLICGAFTAGVVFGALTVNRLDKSTADEVFSALSGTLGGAMNGTNRFSEALTDNVKAVLLIWFLGMTVLGALPLVFYCGFRGYAVGLTVGFMAKYFGFPGVAVSVAGVLPHGIVFFPAMLFLAVQGVLFSTRIIAARGAKIKDSIGTYCIWTILVLIMALAASAIEGFVTPALIKQSALLVLEN